MCSAIAGPSPLGRRSERVERESGSIYDRSVLSPRLRERTPVRVRRRDDPTIGVRARRSIEADAVRPIRSIRRQLPKRPRSLLDSDIDPGFGRRVLQA
ncbi:hypothetical protein BRC68_13550 [Halobacteriales archaeon QH_6_64_20]|nr:MAG: hypothetical protein BRC68_13550 [Halobacteriales archaeon QH_6_64_20]